MEKCHKDLLFVSLSLNSLSPPPLLRPTENFRMRSWPFSKISTQKKNTKQKQSRIFVLNCIQINENKNEGWREKKGERKWIKNHKLDVKQKLRI